MWMYSGRSLRSGSVVYSSRAKSAKAEPVTFISCRPCRPDAQVGHRHAAVADRSSSSQAFDRSPCCAREEDLAGLEAVAIGGRNDGRLEGDLDAADAQPLHVRVRLEEPATDEEQPLLQRRAVERQRLAVDEVLHRVGGDDQAVVALGVRGHERGAQHLDLDVGGQQRCSTGRRSSTPGSA